MSHNLLSGTLPEMKVNKLETFILIAIMIKMIISSTDISNANSNIEQIYIFSYFYTTFKLFIYFVTYLTWQLPASELLIIKKYDTYK